MATASRKKTYGRPPVYPEGTVTKTLATRIPEPVRCYMLVLAARKRFPVTLLYKRAVELMISKKPYEKGLEFRTSPSRDPENYPQVNVILPEELAQRAENDALMQGVSTATYLTTAIYFYARYVEPPENLKKKH